MLNNNLGSHESKNMYSPKSSDLQNLRVMKISNTTVSKFITVEDYHTIELVVVCRKQKGTEVATSQQQIRYRPNISDVNSATSFY